MTQMKLRTLRSEKASFGFPIRLTARWFQSSTKPGSATTSDGIKERRTKLENFI